MLNDIFIAPFADTAASERGRKIGDGTPDEVRKNQDVIDAYLGVEH